MRDQKLSFASFLMYHPPDCSDGRFYGEKIMQKIITGPTGCGKTFQAIAEAKILGRFAYAAPCRLLAYETFIKYAGPNDRLETGAARVVMGDGNLFTCFSGIRPSHIRQGRYQCVIIDEAHWIEGHGKPQERQIKKIIKACIESGTPCLLLTGTLDFFLDGFEIVNLEPIEKFNVVRVSHDDAVTRMEDGAKTLIIASSISDANWCGVQYSAPVISREMAEVDIFQTMLDFNDGKINRLVATNIAAQGLNLPCENLILWLNRYDGRQDIAQKLGRLGRPFMGKDGIILTAFYEQEDYDEDYGDEYCDEEYHASDNDERQLDLWDNRGYIEKISLMSPETKEYWGVDLNNIPEYEDFIKSRAGIGLAKS